MSPAQVYLELWSKSEDPTLCCCRSVFLPYPGYIDILGADAKTVSAWNLNKQYNWVGIIPDVVDYLAESLNFTYDLTLSRDGLWGNYRKETGKWNGIIKDLVDDVGDIGFAPLTVLFDRSSIVDFLLPIYSDRSTFVISRQSSYNNGFITTFKADTWHVIAIVVIISSLVLAFVVRVGKERRAADFRLAHCFAITYGAFCAFGYRGWYTTPVTLSARWVSL